MKLKRLSLILLTPLLFGCQKQVISIQTLFDDAMNEVRKPVSESNIRTLVNVTKDDPNILWNGNTILVCTCHNYPSSYPEGQSIEITWGDSWVVSVKEFSNVYKKKKSEFSSDAYTRTRQLLGLNINSKNEYISSYWVDPSLLIRPAYVTDITASMQTSFPEGTTKEYQNWFYNQIGYSYYSEKCSPWTRLGYTYDWATTSSERYGLTEFKLSSGTVLVEKTAKIPEFLKYLETK